MKETPMTGFEIYFALLMLVTVVGGIAAVGAAVVFCARVVLALGNGAANAVGL